MAPRLLVTPSNLANSLSKMAQRAVARGLGGDVVERAAQQIVEQGFGCSGSTASSSNWQK